MTVEAVDRAPGGDDAGSYGKVQSLLILSFPTLAAFSPLLPVFGPLFAFRIVVPFFFISALFLVRSQPRSLVRNVVSIMCWIWMFALLALSIINPLSRGGFTEVTSTGIGLALLGGVLLGPGGRAAMSTWIQGWLLAFLVTGIIALWEMVSGSHLSNYYYTTLGLAPSQGETEIAATFNNPNDYALFLVFSIPILYIGRAGSRSRRIRLVFNICLLIIPLLVYLTGSRISMGLVVAIALVLFVRVKKRSLSWIMVAAVAIVFVAFTDQRWITSMFGFEGRSLSSEVGSSVSWDIRIKLFLNGLDFLGQSNLMGIGPGAFEDYMAAGVRYEAFGILSPHGGVIEVLAQYGVVVAIAVAIALIQLLVLGLGCFRNEKLTQADRDAGLALALTVLVLPLATMAPSSTLDSSFTWVAFAVFSLVGIHLEQQARTVNLAGRG